MKFITDFQKAAIKFEKEEISYQEMIRWSKSYAKRLELGREERAIVFMENRPEYFYSFLAIWDKRATCVCIDGAFDAETLEYYLVDADAQYIFTSRETSETAKKAIESTGLTLKHLIVDEIPNDYQSDEKEELEYLTHPEKDDVALMLYTSGTTGDSKGVMLTYDNILVNVEGLNKHNIYDASDNILAILPFHHIFPLLGAGIIPLSLGATVVILNEISKNAISKCLKESAITIIISIPRLYEMFHKGIMGKINASKVAKILFKICEKLQNRRLSTKIFKAVHDGFGGNMKYFVAGGAKLEPMVAKDFLTLGLEVLEGYGMTETAPMMAFTPGGQVVPGSAGLVLPGTEMKIAEDGEILVKGRHVMKGYFNKEEATAEAIVDGWMHTGDRGTLEGDRICVTGRKKDMIVLSNGKNINPVEIEASIMLNTNLIEEMAVTEYNNLLTSVVFPNFQKIKELGITNIRETLKWGPIDKYNSSAPAYKKILDLLIVREELPKTKIGKIRRFMLTEFLDKIVSKKREEIVEPDFEEYKILSTYLKGITNREVAPNAHLELDLGLDSLEFVEVLAFLENTFGVEIRDELFLENPTVEELARYLETHSDEIVDYDTNWEQILNKDVVAKLPKDNRLGQFYKVLFSPILKFYLGHKVSGLKNIIEKPVIFAGNHQSFADGSIFTHALSSKILSDTYFTAKVKHFKSSAMVFQAEHCNCLIIDINKKLTETLQTLSSVLKQGKNLVIFPEGVRSRDGKMGEFKKAFAILAKELEIPIVPFGIKGAYKLFDKKRLFLRPGKIEIQFFKQILTKGLSYDEIVAKTERSIKKWVEV